MARIKTEALLKDPEIVREINNYKWIESEKAGADIGFEKASREWINKHSKLYLTARVNQTTMLWLKTSPILNFFTEDITVSK
jgi:hypothetical protein